MAIASSALFKHVRIRDFRPCHDTGFEVRSGIRAISGKNGAGKSNTLKAIEWACSTALRPKSARPGYEIWHADSIAASFETSMAEYSYRDSFEVPSLSRLVGNDLAYEPLDDRSRSEAIVADQDYNRWIIRHESENAIDESTTMRLIYLGLNNPSGLAELNAILGSDDLEIIQSIEMQEFPDRSSRDPRAAEG